MPRLSHFRTGSRANASHGTHILFLDAPVNQEFPKGFIAHSHLLASILSKD